MVFHLRWLLLGCRRHQLLLLPSHGCPAALPVCLQDYLLPPIPELLGLDVPTRSQTQQQYGLSSSALALPGAGAGGLMMQAWNLPGMLGGSRGQNPSYGSRDAGQGSAQQGQSVAVVDDAIRKAQSLRDQLYGVQLMQRFDPQELRMVGRSALTLSSAPLCCTIRHSHK